MTRKPGISIGHFFQNRFSPPSTIDDAINDARKSLIFRIDCSKDQILNDYLNGPRTLSNNQLSALIIGHYSFPNDDETESVEYNVVLCTTHFIGDGHALHTTMTELFSLLGGKCESDDEIMDLRKALEKEWERVEAISPSIPLASEARLPKEASRMQAVATKVDFHCNESRLIVSS